jgi:hypothetical protein
MKLVYLHGFASGPGSHKARYFRDRLPGLVVPDLTRGDFENLSLTGQLKVLAESAGSGPVVLIGSSMGGYLAALYAARHTEVARLVLMAPAFAFARRWREILGPERMAEWQRTGYLETWNYAANAQRRLSWKLMEDAAAYEEFPEFTQPALVFHGLRDDVVPPGFSREFASGHPNVRLQLFDSGHELTDVLDPMWEAAGPFLLTPGQEK